MSEPDWDAHCAGFAAAHVARATGRDIWAEVGGCPKSAQEAADLYRRLKVRNLKGAVSKLLGRAIAPEQAMRGDIALVESRVGGRALPALGIIRGDLIECLDNMLPIGRATCAWKVSQYR